MCSRSPRGSWTWTASFRPTRRRGSCTRRPATGPGGSGRWRPRPSGYPSRRYGKEPDVLIGVPTEVKDSEYRVALTPEGARELTAAGHRVLLQDGAGSGSNIPQERYVRAGAEVVATAEDVWSNAEMILKVKEPIAQEYGRMREGQILFTYLHLAASTELTQAL